MKVSDFSPEKLRKHKAALKRRRERRHARELERKMEEAATEAAEGETDFTKLVEAETARQKRLKESSINAGKQTPRNIAAARENLTLAFDLMGGVPALVVWGRANPTEFYRLWARLIPKESVEVSAQLPLEELLKKLASKEELSVGQAAYEIGTELLEKGRMQAAEEDAALVRKPDDTIQ